MKHFQKVAAAVLRSGDRILIARKSKGHRFEDLWEFPGGKVEAHETPREALERELHEELGIVVRAGDSIGSFRHDYGDFAVELLAFDAEHVSGDFVLTDHQEVRWVGAGELADYEFPEADIPIVQILSASR